MTHTPTEPGGGSSVPEPTTRELEIVRLIAEGLSCREAAKRISRSPRTVENHLRAVYQKWGVHNRVELVRAAESRGVLAASSLPQSARPAAEIELKGHALELIQRVNARLAASDGHNFFNALCLALCEALGVRWAAVWELSEDGERLELIALAADGQIGDYVECPFEGTPCGVTARRGELAVWDGLAAEFPEHELLKELGARVYIGVRLRDQRHGPIGTLSVLHDAPVDRQLLPLEVLRVLAPLVTAELALARAHDDAGEPARGSTAPGPL